MQDNFNNPLTGTLASFSFSNNETANFGPTGTLLTTTGHSYASYLLGLVDTSSVTQNAVAETGGRYKTYAAYIQDDFKVTPRLTLNLGLRWNVWGPFKEVYDRMSFFNPDLPNPLAGNRLGALQFAGNGPNSCHCSTPVKTHYVNPGPRLGLAYRLGEKTVLRAGFSLVYAHAGGVGGRVNGRQGLSQLGFNTSASFSSVATGQPAFNWANGYPAFQPAPFINPSYGIGFITAAAGRAHRRSGHRADHHVRRSRIRRQASVLRELEPQHPAFVHAEPDAQRRVQRQQRALPAGRRQRRSHDQPDPAAIPRAGFPAGADPDAPTTLAQAQALFPNIALPFPNFTGTIAQTLKPFPQYNGIANPWANLGNLDL